MDNTTVQELIQRRIQQIENPPPQDEHLNTRLLQEITFSQKLMNCKIAKSHKPNKNSFIYDHRIIDLKKDLGSFPYPNWV